MKAPALALPFTRSSGKQSTADKLAQRDAAAQAGFYREVDEALREEEIRTAFKRYAAPVGAALGAALLALGFYLWWNNHQAGVRGAQAEQLVLALDKVDSGQQDAAVAQLTPIMHDGTAGNRAAAQMMVAGIAARQGHVDQAAQLFGQLAGDSAAPKPYRDLATVRGTALTFDRLAPADVVARLRPLALPGAPFFGSAGELVGVAYLKEGRSDLAAPLFSAIARDPQVPASLRARARQLAGSLGVDAVDDVMQQPPVNDTPQAAPTPPAASAPPPQPQ